MRSVLVTGASGYIGQHICRALLDAGWQVHGVARGPRPAGLQRVAWTQGDITGPALADRIVATVPVVLHLACLPLAAAAAAPRDAEAINAGGTVTLLEAARRHGVRRFVYVSSLQVYGSHCELPNRETDRCEPDSPYGASKLGGEIWCETYRRAHGLPAQILRLGNVYGAARDGSERPTVESIFLRAIRAGQTPVIRATAGSCWDFVHVDDVVRAIVAALETAETTGPVNVGTGVATTLPELTRLLGELTGRLVDPVILPAAPASVRFQAATERAAAHLGFRSTVSLAEGLRRLVAETE